MLTKNLRGHRHHPLGWWGNPLPGIGEEVWSHLLYPVNPVLRSRRCWWPEGQEACRWALLLVQMPFSIPGEIEMFLTVSCASEEWKLKWKRLGVGTVSQGGWVRGRGARVWWVSEQTTNYVWSLAGRRVDNLGLLATQLSSLIMTRAIGSQAADLRKP